LRVQLRATLLSFGVQGVQVEEIAAPRPGIDLAHLMICTCATRRDRSPNLPLLLLQKLATAERSHRLTGLPLVMLDLTIESRSHETAACAD